VRIVFLHADGDLDLFLYDGRGNPLSDSQSTEDVATVSVGIDADTAHYVRVLGYEGADNLYDLFVHRTGCVD